MYALSATKVSRATALAAILVCWVVSRYKRTTGCGTFHVVHPSKWHGNIVQLPNKTCCYDDGPYLLGPYVICNEYIYIYIRMLPDVPGCFQMFPDTSGQMSYREPGSHNRRSSIVAAVHSNTQWPYRHIHILGPNSHNVKEHPQHTSTEDPECITGPSETGVHSRTSRVRVDAADVLCSLDTDTPQGTSGTRVQLSHGLRRCPPQISQ